MCPQSLTAFHFVHRPSHSCMWNDYRPSPLLSCLWQLGRHYIRAFLPHSVPHIKKSACTRFGPLYILQGVQVWPSLVICPRPMSFGLPLQNPHSPSLRAGALHQVCAISQVRALHYPQHIRTNTGVRVFYIIQSSPNNTQPTGKTAPVQFLRGSVSPVCCSGFRLSPQPDTIPRSTDEKPATTPKRPKLTLFRDSLQALKRPEYGQLSKIGTEV